MYTTNAVHLNPGTSSSGMAFQVNLDLLCRFQVENSHTTLLNTGQSSDSFAYTYTAIVNPGGFKVRLMSESLLWAVACRCFVGATCSRVSDSCAHPADSSIDSPCAGALRPWNRCGARAPASDLKVSARQAAAARAHWRLAVERRRHHSAAGCRCLQG